MSITRYGMDGLTSQNQGAMRLDAKKLAQVRVKRNAEFLLRNDAVSESQAYHFARELEHVYNEVLRDQYAPNSALELFPIDTSVSAGSKTHTVRRIQHEADVRYYRGNSSNRGSTSVTRVEQEFPVHPIVTSIKLNFFDQLSADFANTTLRSELEFAAEQGLNDFLNDKTWEGDEEMNVLGVINYPWVPKTTSAVSFANTTDADTILDELHRLANQASEISESRFSPTTMLMSVKLRNRLATRKRSATTDQTILEAFLEDNEYVSVVRGVPELSEAGPNGEDVIVLYRAGDRRSVANVVPRGMTMLPMQDTGFDTEIPIYMLHGGVVMRDVLSNLVAFVTI